MEFIINEILANYLTNQASANKNILLFLLQ